MKNNAANKLKQVPVGYLVIGIDPHKKRQFAPGHTYRELAAAAGIRDDLFQERSPEAYKAITRCSSRLLRSKPIVQGAYTRKMKEAIRGLLIEQLKCKAAGATPPLHWQPR